MAFGTGAHPTTQLCLELIEERLPGGTSVLDVGTGSGILAFAAAAMGASDVLGLDLDPVAVAAARENQRANPFAGHVRWIIGTAAAIRGQYDWVLANLIAEVLRSDAATLAARVAPGGVLLAAGIIAERAGEVRAALAAHELHLEAERSRGEWVAMLARRRAPQ
jgi:ribosomal protein L11 methyltransferase